MEKAALIVNKVKKTKCGVKSRKNWSGKMKYKRSALEEKEIEFLNCTTQLGKHMLDKKEEGVMGNNADDAFKNS